MAIDWASRTTQITGTDSETPLLQGFELPPSSRRRRFTGTEAGSGPDQDDSLLDHHDWATTCESVD